MQLNNRKLAVLSLIAKGYLKTGEPVGSKSLVSELDGSVSSATIRNDMAQLERLGLVFQPHTSAGRIPTNAGMSLYVERLMQKRSLSQKRKELINSLLSSAYSVQGAISAASEILAKETGCASFSVSPSGNSVLIRQIDFIKTGSCGLIFVILTDTGVVKSVYVNLSAPVSEDALAVLSSVSEKSIKGVLLSDITPPYVQTIAANMPDYSLLFSPFFEALLLAAEELLCPEVYVKGQDNIVDYMQQSLNAARALNILKAEKLLNLPKVNGNSVSIIIPEDLSGSAALIYSGYKLTDNLIGSIGVLGPYRLDYGSVIPMIEYFSSSLENMIKTSQIDS